MIRAALICLFLAAPVAAQPATVARVVDAIARLDTVGKALAGADDAGNRVAALTQAVRAFEAAMATLRETGRKAHLERAAMESRLDAQAGDITRLLAALQAAGAPTTATRLLHPQGPLGSARSAALFVDVISGLQGEAAILAETLGDLQRLEGALDRASAALAEGAEGIRRARLALVRAAEQGAGVARSDTDAAVADALGLAARNLEELALAVSENPVSGVLDAARTRSDVPELGALILPVEGAVVKRFEPANGHAGVSIATLPGALVMAPTVATVRFGGFLPGVGQVVVLEFAPGRLLIVTGLHDVLVNAGQVLPPDAPLGLMGGTDESASRSQFDRGALLTETLYIEARTDGRPVDPARWFVLDKE